MIQNITTMVKALSKKYPDRCIDIRKEYKIYPFISRFIIEYFLYVENTVCLTSIKSFNLLQKEVQKLLKGKE